MIDAYRTIHIYRGGQSVLVYNCGCSGSIFPPHLSYQRQEDLDWFKSLDGSHPLTFKRIVEVPEGDDDLTEIENTLDETTKSKLLKEMGRYKEIKNMIKFYDSVEDLLDSI